MRVFLTGASGLIGSRLVGALLARGDEVVALTRRPRDDRDGLRWIVGDPLSPSGWGAALDGCDAVVNLAGEPLVGRRWTRRQKERIVASRVGTTSALHHAIREAKVRPRALLSASAVGYYGTSDDDTFDESSPPGGDFLARVTGAWEDAARRCEELGLRVVRLRLGVVLDARGGFLGRVCPVVRSFAGGFLGESDPWVSWIHHTDVTGLVLRALDEAIEGPLNLVSPAPCRQRELLRALARRLHRPLWLHAPSWALRLGLGEMAEVTILRGQRVLPERARALGYRWAHASIDEAIAAECG